MRSHETGLIFFPLQNNLLLMVYLYLGGREKAAALPVPCSVQTLLNLPRRSYNIKKLCFIEEKTNAHFTFLF